MTSNEDALNPDLLIRYDEWKTISKTENIITKTGKRRQEIHIGELVGSCAFWNCNVRHPENSVLVCAGMGSKGHICVESITGLLRLRTYKLGVARVWVA